MADKYVIVIGVRLADGSEHRADVVVSAADGYSTIFEMLGGRYVDETIKSRYNKWQLFRPTVMISWGVAREFPGEPTGRGIVLKSPIRLGSGDTDALWLRIFNYSPRFAPPGKTVIQVMLETDWDHWHSLQRDRQRYLAEKERVAKEVLDRIEPYYPGLSGQVEVTDVATPYTTWRYTRNRRGSPEGWLPTPKNHNDPDSEDAAGSGRVLHGRAMGNAGRRRDPVPLLGPARRSDHVPARPNQVDNPRLGGTQPGLVHVAHLTPQRHRGRPRMSVRAADQHVAAGNARPVLDPPPHLGHRLGREPDDVARHDHQPRLAVVQHDPARRDRVVRPDRPIHPGRITGHPRPNRRRQVNLPGRSSQHPSYSLVSILTGRRSTTTVADPFGPRSTLSHGLPPTSTRLTLVLNGRKPRPEPPAIDVRAR